MLVFTLGEEKEEIDANVLHESAKVSKELEKTYHGLVFQWRKKGIVFSPFGQAFLIHWNPFGSKGHHCVAPGTVLIVHYVTYYIIPHPLKNSVLST